MNFMEVLRGAVEDDLSGLIRKKAWDGLGMGSECFKFFSDFQVWASAYGSGHDLGMHGLGCEK